MVSRLKNLRDLVYSIIRKQGVGRGPGITNIGTNTLKLNQEAMDIIAEMQKAGYKIENIDEASIKIFLNNRNQPAPTGKQIIDSMEKTDIYSQDNPFIGFKPEIVKDTKKLDPRVVQPKGAKMDVMQANENLAGGANYAKGDIKYNADVLADEIARMRGIDRADLSARDSAKFYSEAYDYLINVNRLNKPKKATSAKDLMKELAKMTSKNVDDIKLGIASKTKKTKDPVDPVLQEMEDKAKPFKEFEARDKTRSGKINYEVMENFLGTKLRGNESFDELLEIERKAKAKKPPEDKADGGRIGFGNGSTGSGLPAIQLESQSKMEQYGPGVEIPGSPRVPMGKFGPVNIGIFGGGSYGKNEIIPGVNMATTDQNYGITGQIPIGDTGFTIGGDYMKSRANERFTGGNNQVLKTVPVDSDRFNVGINFTKRFKDGGRIGFKDGSKMSRRGFLKLIGGLATLPIVGKFFKGAKTAAKVTEAATSTSGVPAYFPKLVEKIKKFGDDVTEKAAVTERQRVTEYKDYTLEEDLSTGDVRVIKTNKSGDGYVTPEGDFDFDGVTSEEVLEFKKGYADIDTKTGKVIEVPNEYGETTTVKDYASPNRTEVEVENGLTNVDQIMKEVGMIKTDYKMSPGGKLRNKKKKLASGGVAYMLGE
jgi:hypothetical protein